jgi:hypothetical protein
MKELFFTFLILFCVSFSIFAKNDFFDFKVPDFYISKVIGSQSGQGEYIIRYCGQVTNYKYVFYVTKIKNGSKEYFKYYLSNHDVFKLGDNSYKLVVLGSKFRFKEYKEKR